MTDEEMKAEIPILDMTDEELGGAIRKAVNGFEDRFGGVMPAVSACAMFLIQMVYLINADTSTVNENGVTFRGIQIGDWKVTVEKKKGNLK